MVGVAIRKFAHHPDVRVRFRAVLLVLAIILIAAKISWKARAIVDIQARGPNAGGAQKFHLLGLAIVNRGRLRKRIQVVVFESALGYLGRPEPAAGAGRKAREYHRMILRLHLVHVPRHQFDVSVIELLAALVVQSDPTYQVQGVARFRRDDVLIAGPVHAARDIA